MNRTFEIYREFIPDYDSFIEGISRPLPIHVRINELKIEPEIALKNLEEEGIILQNSVPDNDTLYRASNLRSSGNIMAYFLGHIHPQALTSCLVPLVLSPDPGSYVLDMCASPGGKTSQMAQHMGNTGLIVANELYTDRHIPLAHTLARLGVVNTIQTAYQAQEFPLREPFDFVLADVPCSGEGRFRVNGKMPVYRMAKENAKLPELQKKIILRGFDLLKPGGVMVYATCTYDPAENEAIVDFLLKNREAELFPVDLRLPCEPGITEWKNESYEKVLRRSLRFYPHQLDSVGFFMAKIGRRR